MPRSALWDKILGMRPHLIVDANVEIPACFSSVEREYWALKEGAGLLDLSRRGRILVRGDDSPRFLHGMVTNDVQGLKAGQGNYAFLLNVHGHILADLRNLRLDSESYLLDCEPQSHDVVTGTLDRHIVADVVELQDLRSELACLAIEGPCARQALSGIIGEEVPEMEWLDHVYRSDAQIRLVRASLSGQEGYWVLMAPERAAELWASLLSEKAAPSNVNIQPVGSQALEVARIEAGIPRYGIDITEKNLPQETGQMQAISFNKGCYVGQEVVERIRSRGHVNSSLVQLMLDGSKQVAPETEILSAGLVVGHTASSAYSFGLRKTLAFGYVRREYAEPGKRLTVAGFSAEVKTLPSREIRLTATK